MAWSNVVPRLQLKTQVLYQIDLHIADVPMPYMPHCLQSYDVCILLLNLWLHTSVRRRICSTETTTELVTFDAVCDWVVTQ
jgi:hypothetical protein